jgi:hypothetical protein
MMKSWSKKIWVWGTLVTLPLGLLEIAHPTVASANQFNDCTRQIIGTGVSPQDAGQACSDALIPKELSRCVAMIQGRTPIDGNSALLACYQVRRPIDLANCVVDIHQKVPLVATNSQKQVETGKNVPDLSKQTLNSCRKSLLPGRFSECVIALSRDIPQSTPAEALDTCLSAEDFPRDLFPSYPQNQNQNPGM